MANECNECQRPPTTRDTKPFPWPRVSKSHARHTNRTPFDARLMRTLKYAFRTLSKSPFVTAVAVLSLGLGIGANAAIFSLFNQTLLRPLPVAQPQRLVNLSAPGPKPGSTSCSQAGDCEDVFSYPMFRDLERTQSMFTGIAAHRAISVNLAFRNQTLNGQGMLVSGSYFPMLGIRPFRGRLLSPSDDETIGAHPVAVLSHSFWQSHLGADPSVINETMVVNGASLTIIGIAPKGFEGTTLGVLARVFVPITMRQQLSPQFRGFDNRRDYWAYLFARLKPNVSLTQAGIALNGVYRPILTDVEAPLQDAMSEQTMKRFKSRDVRLTDGRQGQSSVHREARIPLTLLLSITAIVLLIACANIANLLLARAANRSTEMAVRLSLGAGRRQLVTQLLTESLLLALMGGALSLIIAQWTLSFIGSVIPPETATTIPLTIEPSIVVFTAVMSVGTGLLFGLFPALHSTRSDLVTTIRSSAGNLSSARSATRFRTSLVTAQIALSMALLISAGLFIRSLANVSRVDLGIKVDRVVTFAISPSLNGYQPARSAALFNRTVEELQALPGVSAVTSARVAVLAGNNWGNSVSVEGFKETPDTDDGAAFNMTGPGFFATLGIPLLAGREFTAADEGRSPKVAVVNEAFAKKFNLGRHAVGKRLTNNDSGPLDIEIVGLVKDAKYSEVKDEIPPQFFVPWRQDSTVGGMIFYIRTASEPEQVIRTIPSIMATLDPNLPIEDLKTLPQQVKENVFMDRMISTLSAAFAVLATLLAAVGLYGVLAYTVAQRTREFGVRMALGADGGMVRRMVLRQVGRMTLIGGVVGIAGALALGRGAQSLLFGVQGFDPLVIVAATTLLAIVSLGAGYLPALRASKVNPMQALRYD